MGNGIAVVVLILLLLNGRRSRGPSAPSYAGIDTKAVWPVPTLYTSDGAAYEATVSSDMGSERTAKDGTRRPHRGLDIMYRRRGPGDRPEHPPNVRMPDGFASATNYFAPMNTPVQAVRAGKVWSVTERKDGGGWSVIVDHGKPWATYYTHLVVPTVIAGTPVVAGETIGLMGGNLSDASRIRHLHFEVWYDGHGSKASVDVWADNVMDEWERKSWWN